MIAVVGLGAMGGPIARSLARAGRTVVVTDTDPDAVRRVADDDAGIRAAASVAEVAACPVVLLSLPGPEAVLAVVRDLAAGGATGLVLDTSTVGPDTSRQAATVMAASGGRYCDAPVLGRPAAAGAWTFPVGGADGVLDTVREALAPLAKAVVPVGDVGAAATLKVLNNLMLGTINAVTAEVLLLAEAAGLDPGVLVDVVTDSGAASVSGLFRDVAPRAVAGDFRPTFSVRLMHKDNALALDLADRHGVPLAVGRAAQGLNALALEQDLGEEDSIAVLKGLETATGLTARRHGSSS